MRMCTIFGTKWPICPEHNFLVQTIVITFIYLLVLFIVQNLKNSYNGSRIMTLHHVLAQSGEFAPNNFFLVIYYYHSHLPISPFHCAKLKKKFFQQIQSYEDVQLLGPKWPISSNENFFRKPVNEPCFFHSCLSTCQKSKPDINLLVKYWRLKNTEISLAESHFWL